MTATASSELPLEYTQDTLAVVDESGTYTYANGAAERLVGFDRETLLGTNAFDYVHPADRSSVLADFESVVGTTSSFAAETATDRHRTADGDWSELLFCNPAYGDVYGRPVGDVEADSQELLCPTPSW